MQKKLGLIVCAVALVAGCAEYEKQVAKRPLRQQMAATVPAPKLTPEQQARATKRLECLGRHRTYHVGMIKEVETEEQHRITDADCAEAFTLAPP
jgi:hypothetical protein